MSSEPGANVFACVGSSQSTGKISHHCMFNCRTPSAAAGVRPTHGLTAGTAAGGAGAPLRAAAAAGAAAAGAVVAAGAAAAGTGAEAETETGARREDRGARHSSRHWPMT